MELLEEPQIKQEKVENYETPILDFIEINPYMLDSSKVSCAIEKPSKSKVSYTMADIEEQVIEAVRGHKVLYDTKDKNYMKAKLKTRIWNDISQKLNLKDGEEAKTIWLKLRGNFRDARRRQQRCLKSGVARENIKPWRFQKKMAFLKPFMSTGPREGNLVDESDDDSQPMSEAATSENFDSQEMELAREEEVRPDTNISRGFENGTDNEQSNGVISSNNKSSRSPQMLFPQTSSSTAVMYKKRRIYNGISATLKQSIQQREERARQRAEDRKKLSNLDDPLYNFFISMYQLTKNMTPDFQHSVRAQVFNAVSDAEASMMNIPSYRPPSTLSYSNDSISGSIPPSSIVPSPHTSPS